MTPEHFLATHSLFTRSELEQVLRARGSRSRETVTSHLGRWKRLGRVMRAKQGLYVRLDAERSGGAVPVDYLALASKMAPDAILAYHTALEAHGHAQSFFELLTFQTWTKTKPLEFQGRRFVPVRPRAELGRKRYADRWVERLDRGDQEVRVTTIERTLVDLFDRPDLAGGVYEVWRSCSSIPALDLQAVETYLRLLARPTLTAKVGYFLERMQESLAVPDRLIERLSRRVSRGVVYMDRGRKSRLASRWRLMVPEELLYGEGDETL